MNGAEALEVFFTSYARLDNTDAKLGAAVKALSERLTKKLGEGVTVFFDTTDLKNGVDWETALAKRLQQMRLIVCFCSPAYLKSAFCAKEFEVFRRRVDKNSFTDVAIIPVVWEPVSLPEGLGRFHQPKDPRFPSDYYVAGLYQLGRLKSQEDNFLTAVETLANDIAQAYAVKQELPPWPEDVKYDDLPNFPANPSAGSYGISITVLNDKNSQWKAGSLLTSVGAMVDAVSQARGLGWEEIPAGQGVQLLQRLEDAAKRRLASVLIADQDDAAKAPWSQILEQIGKSSLTSVGILIGCGKGDPAAHTQVKHQLATSSPALAADTFTLGDEQGFRDALTRVATTLRLALLQQDQAAKVVSPPLRDAAVNQGIPVDSVAPLQGPGSAS